MIEDVKTKIVATVGPASGSVQMLEKLIKAGVDVFRLNFSHGEFSVHEESIKNIRKASANLKTEVAVLADLPGPKIRLGKFEQPVDVKAGKEIILSASENKPADLIFPIEFKELPKFVKKGEDLLIDDGKILLKVTDVKGSSLKCRVIEGGKISSRKGINLPQTHLPIPVLTDKDKEIIRFAVKHDIDWFALSFVMNPKDVIDCKKYIKKCGADVPVISKLEKFEVFDDLDEIIQASDAVMVARGDLGVEIPIEEVPQRQKQIISRCNALGKPVITATQMLESMISSYRPTRAEVSDVANAILDGTDAIMLSGETSVGEYPVETVTVMNKIAIQTQKQISSDYTRFRFSDTESEIGLAVAHSAVNFARNIKASAIICFTQSGVTPARVSRFKPPCSVISYATNIKARRRTNLYWGVYSKEIPCSFFDSKEKVNIDDLIKWVVDDLKKEKCCKKPAKIVIVAGVPISEAGNTNMLRVVEI